METKFKLIEGEFALEDAIQLITQMVRIKIQFHEERIQKDSNEEDVKIRESRIKRLQQDLFDLRKELQTKEKSIALETTIYIHPK
jgi:hypothetical protein